MKLKILSWNVRDANASDKRKVIKNFLRSHKVDLVCLQETKVQEMTTQSGGGTLFELESAELRRIRRGNPFALG